jgi:hypothetical protein
LKLKHGTAIAVNYIILTKIHSQVKANFGKLKWGKNGFMTLDLPDRQSLQAFARV